VGDLALAGEVPLDQLLQRIVESARALLNARYAALGVFGADRRLKQFYTAGLTPEERSRIGALPVGVGLLGLIAHEPRIVRIPRIASHPASIGFPPNHPPMTSFLGGPIALGNRIYGDLYLTDRQDAPEFTDADEQLFGTLAHHAALAIENSERFAREHALLDQAQLERASLEAIFDSMTDAVLTTDLDGRIIRLNQRAAAWAETSTADAVGRLADEVFPLFDEFGSRVHWSISDERPIVELSLRRSNSDVIPVSRAVAPIRDASGLTVGTIQVLRDLRPQREVEQLKANIISLVSHELRTPLSHIKGYASSLLQPDVSWDEATTRDFIASIERQADRLARLISDLLEISQLDAGGTSRLELEPVAPGALVERGLRQALPSADGHPLTSRVSDGLPPVLADTSHVERVLTNLIDNAAKYSPKGAPIVVDVARTGEMVTFAVADQGTGLTPEEQGHLFQRFYRSPRVKHRTPGTGLGLAICREIVQAHGGKIWAESVEGEGSVFRFTLPIAPSARSGRWSPSAGGAAG
jgi:PAS domain S-box-containing protein